MLSVRCRVLALVVAVDATGCSHDWEGYDPDNPGNRYWCGFQVSDGRIIIRVDANYQKLIDTNNTVVDLTQTPGYSPTAPHVMHFDVIGNTLHCWVDGVVGADVTGVDNTYASGTFGLKTYLQHASFDDVQVCD